ncbi:MAG TPA: thymidylate synthase [Candidatus Nanoarchaeia archaeon]|nr:thymidylate synthase [Candidatus Nanoarchaeia archaeon]
MDAYLEIVERILQKGVSKENRTGITTLTIFGEKFEHDMTNGFPLQTTKKMRHEGVFSELEFFIKGLTDKRWLQERKNHIWDDWCNPEKVPYGHDEETKRRMREEPDLGPIYGFQWRHFGAEYRGPDIDYTGQGFDQLSQLVSMIKKDPTDRRMIVNSWNPTQLYQMGLPPCHYSFQVDILDNKLHLSWNQRSVDVMLGLPYNIASYAALLHLLAKETGYQEGKLIGNLGDTQIYSNHVDKAKEQLTRKPFPLPSIETENFKSIFDWKYTDTKILNYQHHPFIKFDIAV